MTPCACAHRIPHRSTLSAQMHPIQVLLFPLRVLIPHKPMYVWPNQKKNLKVPKKMPCPTDPKCNDPLRLCSPHTPQINPKRPNAPDSSFTIPPYGFDTPQAYSYLSNKCEVTLILFWTFGNWILSYLSSHTYFFQGYLKICTTIFSNFVSFSCWVTKC